MYSKAAEADKNRLREAASRKRRQKEQLSSDRGKKSFKGSCESQETPKGTTL